jgi:phospholipase C
LGGYYDHVAPPEATPPGDNPDGSLNVNGFDFSRYGVRVPALVISPLTKKGVVSHDLFDHTSILKTVQLNFEINKSLTQRDEQANSLLDLLESPMPRADAPVAITPHTLSTASVKPVARDAGDLISADPPPAGSIIPAATPLPERGNIIGFLHIALKCEVEMSDGSEIEKQAIIDNFKATVHTYGDAEAYFKRIATELRAYKAAKQADR